MEHAQRFIKYQNDRGGNFEIKKVLPHVGYLAFFKFKKSFIYFMIIFD